MTIKCNYFLVAIQIGLKQTKIKTFSLQVKPFPRQVDFKSLLRNASGLWNIQKNLFHKSAADGVQLFTAYVLPMQSSSPV